MIATGVAVKLTPALNELKELVTKLTVTVGGIAARVMIIETTISSGKTTRPTRTADGKSRAGTPVAAGKPKLTNAMLFCRYAYGQNLNNIRNTLTPELLAAAAVDPAVMKKPIEADETAHYTAIGLFVWKSFKSDAEKEHIRTLHREYNEAALRDAAAPQLNEVEK